MDSDFIIVYGKQILSLLLQRNRKAIEEVYLSKEIDKKLFSQIASLGVTIERVDNKKAQGLSKGGNHQGVILKVRPPKLQTLEQIKDANFVLVFAGITDMGNIGSLIRSAYALGVDAVVITAIKELKLDMIAKTSSGALFEMPLCRHFNLNDTLNMLKQRGFTLYGADMHGKSVNQSTFVPKRALVLGNEHTGIPNRALQMCDSAVKIEMRNGFDSLGVAAAGAILIDRMR